MLGRLKLGRSTATLAVFTSVAVLLAGLPRAAATADPHANTPARAGKKKSSSCAACGAGSLAPSLDGLSTLGRRTQATPLLTVQRTPSEGARVNLVSTSRGDLAFAVNDLETGGALPALFQRVYASDRAEDRGLGAGWSFAFDDRVTVEGDEAVLTTGSGRTAAFRRSGFGGRFVLKDAEPGPHQSFELTDSDTINETAAGLSRTYIRIGEVFRLTRVAAPSGDAVTVGFDGRGNVTRIAGAGGAALTLKWSAGGDARLLWVADPTGRRVSFVRDGRRLRSVVDAAGGRWSYDYDASGRLTRAADPSGRVLLRALYGAGGRAAEAGDAAGAYRFDYETAAGAVSLRTVVTDPIGASVVFAHTGRGALASADDAEGRLFAVEYDALNRPARVADSFGEEKTFAYDAEGRVLRQSSGGGAGRSYAYDAGGRISSVTDGGTRTDYSYDARGNLAAARGVAGKRSHEATFDARGRLTSLKFAGGTSVSFEYNAAGNQTASVYSGAGRFETDYDAAGRRVAQRLPSGLTYKYEYDARGRQLGLRDNAGHSLKVEREPGGAVSAVSAGGRWVRATRDEAGRVVALANSEGQTRRFEYDARGALTAYVDARGARRSFEYDARGRVSGMTDAGGATLRFAYDRAGRLASVRRVGRAESAAARFVAAGYTPPDALAPPAPPPAQGGHCMFDGGGDGWFAGDSWEQTYGAGCWDPVGEFGGMGGGDGFGDFSSGGSFEPCQKCRARQETRCRYMEIACVASVLGMSVFGVLGCMGLSAGTLTLACLGYGSLAAASLATGCVFLKYACMLDVPERCVMCPPV